MSCAASLLGKELPGGGLGVEVNIRGPSGLVQSVATLVFLSHSASTKIY